MSDADRDVAADSKERAGLKHLLLADGARMLALTAVGCVALALFEYVGMLYTTPAPDVRTATAFRLIFVDIALIALLWAFLAVPVTVALAVGIRLARKVLGYSAGTDYPGLWAPGPGDASDQPRASNTAAWLWAVLIGAGAYMATSTYVTYKAITHFKEPQLTAFLLAFVQLFLIAVTMVLAYLALRAARAVGGKLQPILGRLNLLGNVDAAAVCVAVIGFVGIKVAISFMPQLAPKVPWRKLMGLAVVVLGMRVGLFLLARRGHILPVADRRKRRMIALGGGLAVLLLVPLTLFQIGADHETKSVAITGSPLMQSIVDSVRSATDFDDDGYGFLLGENDCDPFASHIHPLARDIPDNGIDEDCNGRDFSLAMLRAHKKGDTMAVPDAFVRNWNFLFITIDTVRYDHTGFGGYIKKTGRNTTPELDKLVQRSISFDFAQAPSAGTMASIPSTLTSKFFHSGIALDEKNIKPNMPPILKPENLLIGELMSEHGYYTGAITSHEYFNNWGMEQGMDTYDNEVGKKHAPRAVTSHKLTDKVLAWIGRNYKRPKWFLWAHYIDPHGRYVEHPGEVSFGKTEEDLYDGELHYTDKHLGRLFHELAQMPGADRTIIIITSDHGDGFMEHGFINHAQALYRELVHVPLVFYIPELPPRRVGGAVTPLDIFPTMADLAGIDISDLSLEGESLVPQLFYGREDHERVVFSETNWPRPLRAAISSRYKLLYKVQNNIYEFYDLKLDPWEKKNIYNSANSKALGEMKEHMDSWLERVYYARDPVMNQNLGQLQKYLVNGTPKPQVPLSELVFDKGSLEILGFDRAKNPLKAGETAEVFLYLKVVKRPSADFRFQMELWPITAEGTWATARPRTARSGLRMTARGRFPSSRWRPGEVIRERFKVKLPKGWTAGVKLGVGLRATSSDRRTKIKLPGPKRQSDQHLANLGTIDFVPAPTPAPAGAVPPGVKPGQATGRPAPVTPANLQLGKPNPRAGQRLPPRKPPKPRPGPTAGAPKPATEQ